MKNLITIILFALVGSTAYSQGAFVNFIDYQRGFTRPSDALKRKEDTLQKQFIKKGTGMACQIRLYTFF